VQLTVAALVIRDQLSDQSVGHFARWKSRRDFICRPDGYRRHGPGQFVLFAGEWKQGARGINGDQVHGRGRQTFDRIM
jgi:hypothetical protein